MRLAEKVALLTGAAGGIGTAIALEMAREGANVVLNDIREDLIAGLSEQIKATNSRALPLTADVTSTEEVKRMVQSAVDAFGEIDILVNAAGGSRASVFHETPDDYWNSVIDLNLKGTLICCHEVIGSLIRAGGGRIINIGSAAGMIGSSNGLAAYSAAKAGVIGFTKSLAKELAPYGINVNCVSPGPIQTELYSTLAPETQKAIIASTYVKRIGRPEEVAHLVSFLCSEEAGFITGQNYAICGGRTLGW
jgi:NAD(P)-dependent dehydrogenase (short-subunit alcohol dehydrogenase family)